MSAECEHKVELSEQVGGTLCFARCLLCNMRWEWDREKDEPTKVIQPPDFWRPTGECPEC